MVQNQLQQSTYPTLHPKEQAQEPSTGLVKEISAEVDRADNRQKQRWDRVSIAAAVVLCIEIGLAGAVTILLNFLGGTAFAGEQFRTAHNIGAFLQAVCAALLVGYTLSRIAPRSAVRGILWSSGIAYGLSVVGMLIAFFIFQEKAPPVSAYESTVFRGGIGVVTIAMTQILLTRWFIRRKERQA